MKCWISQIMLIATLLLIGCEDNPTVSSGDIWLELEADTLSGIAPLTVTFTGTLHGNIRNLKLSCQNPMLCIAYRKPCIIYCPYDTTYSAVRTYQKEGIYSDSGQFWIFMQLRATDRTIISDTLLITVQQQGSAQD